MSGHTPKYESRSVESQVIETGDQEDRKGQEISPLNSTPWRLVE